MSSLFLDESKTKGYTIVTAAIVQADVSTMRKEIAKLRKNGQNRVHFVNESDSRRRQILSTLESIGITARIYHVTGMKDPDAREGCLAAIVADAARHGITRIVLERDDSIEKFDRKILYRELDVHGARNTITYAHYTAKEEPLLWAPDAIAWSFARGGEWISRIRPLITDVTNLSR
jgi:hypothetical protein